VPGDLPDELMKGVVERGEQQHREITEAERADKQRASRKGTSGPARKKKGKASAG